MTEDRVWSLAASTTGLLTVGTAGTRGTCPLRLYDLATGAHVLDMGAQLRNGAGMLDLAWLSHATFLACGYDTFTRLWDTRQAQYLALDRKVEAVSREFLSKVQWW